MDVALAMKRNPRPNGWGEFVGHPTKLLAQLNLKHLDSKNGTRGHRIYLVCEMMAANPKENWGEKDVREIRRNLSVDSNIDGDLIKNACALLPDWR